jgi:hypothetical protein
VSLHLLLISRQQVGYACFSRIKPVIAPQPEPDTKLLSWLIECPEQALEFSRIGPIEIAHGGDWARRRHLDSLRWPLLGGSVIHGRAVGLRLGVPWPGEGPGLKPPAMRALTEWECSNAERCFLGWKQELLPTECWIHKRFLWSLPFPLLDQFQKADEAGRLAIRLQVMAEREAAKAICMPKIQAEVAANQARQPVGIWRW